ncbi:hypothetical protein SARC_10654 [Sphaeroforma arctica JP610]|uniref:Uncharacterized protein n=1 Tax=Sphaeroforma arctica JP610 TaxID=667725 RepID=A0A0L0FLG4_9EUKA|nr:hypothetical protein SARC_10654 [Sphaeroforma arctica JP610]KNC76868.1 hypothetical protein SARC_10654 [Sphaeroforma arctica JP610]|eukprot:XP_014150770.1 hypothetical protein SARC_10654 [Sphaeroforma arctica JP610]
MDGRARLYGNNRTSRDAQPAHRPTAAPTSRQGQNNTPSSNLVTMRPIPQVQVNAITRDDAFVPPSEATEYGTKIIDGSLELMNLPAGIDIIVGRDMLKGLGLYIGGIQSPLAPIDPTELDELLEPIPRRQAPEHDGTRRCTPTAGTKFRGERDDC